MFFNFCEFRTTLISSLADLGCEIYHDHRLQSIQTVIDGFKPGVSVSVKGKIVGGSHSSVIESLLTYMVIDRAIPPDLRDHIKKFVKLSLGRSCKSINIKLQLSHPLKELPRDLVQSLSGQVSLLSGRDDGGSSSNGEGSSLTLAEFMASSAKSREA